MQKGRFGVMIPFQLPSIPNYFFIQQAIYVEGQAIDV
jgi:hypothetical protein